MGFSWSIHYDYNIYAIKFFLKHHRQSETRYSYSYPKTFKDAGCRVTGNRNFLKTMSTVLEISKEIIKIDGFASFGYMGAPKPKELDPDFNGDNINEDFTVGSTKRYKVYHLYAKRYFNPREFEYIDSKTSSILLLRNNKNKILLNTAVAEDYINNDIIPNL